MKNRGIDINLIKKMTRPKVASAPKLGKSFKTIICMQPDCNREVVVDSDAQSVICHICIAKMVGYDAVPTVSKKYTSEERKARKMIVAKKKVAQQAYKEKYKDFPRGWHKRLNYTHSDGKKYQNGIEVKEFTIKPRVIKKSSGMPRGWHLHKHFVHNGITYSYGKVVK